MKFTINNISSSELEVTITENNDKVLFEKAEEVDSHEYSGIYQMNGYVDGVLTYGAYGEYEYGSDDFVELSEVELI
jgi:hypothetical protein